jgi:membrane-associated protease RseP (regulator of RpoE activity)
LNERSVLDSLGLFFAKMAALNLLPVPMLNGGDALLALLGMNSASERANAILRQIAIWPMLLVWCSWLVAGAVYAFS